MTVVIVREDFLNDQPQLSAMLDYRIQAEAGSLYNTPPCFNIYISKLVFDWVKNEIGGVDKMAEIQREKSGLLYDYIESSDFYTNPVQRCQGSFCLQYPICNHQVKSWMLNL